MVLSGVTQWFKVIQRSFISKNSGKLTKSKVEELPVRLGLLGHLDLSVVVLFPALPQKGDLNYRIIEYYSFLISECPVSPESNVYHHSSIKYFHQIPKIPS